MICKFSSNNLRKCLTDNKWLINFVLPLSLANRKTIKVLFPEEAEERQNFQELFPDYKSVIAKFESLNIKHQRQSSVSEGAQLVQHQHVNFSVSKIIFVTMSILGIAIVSKASSVESHIWDLKRFWYQVVYLVHQIWGKNDCKRKFFFDEYLLIFSAIISSGAPCKCEVYSLVMHKARAAWVTLTRIARQAWSSLCYKSIAFGWCPPWHHRIVVFQTINWLALRRVLCFALVIFLLGWLF